jgi:MoxR-like ATPase
VKASGNSEKNLPDAFLRRCVFYHIPFPEKGRLSAIVQRRMKLNDTFTPAVLDHALDHFQEIRQLSLKKKPATAELLSWLRILDKMKLDVNQLQPGQAEALAFTYAVLAKNSEDKEMIMRHLQSGQ